MLIGYGVAESAGRTRQKVARVPVRPLEVRLPEQRSEGLCDARSYPYTPGVALYEVLTIVPGRAQAPPSWVEMLSRIWYNALR